VKKITIILIPHNTRLLRQLWKRRVIRVSPNMLERLLQDMTEIRERQLEMEARGAESEKRLAEKQLELEQ
jgi:hypothetical protein